jgi:hypothetical protein
MPEPAPIPCRWFSNSIRLPPQWLVKINVDGEVILQDGISHETATMRVFFTPDQARQLGQALIDASYLATIQIDG